MPEDFRHYGVKGMKWGVRRDRDSSGSSSRKKGSDSSEWKKAAEEVSKETGKLSPAQKAKNLAEAEAKFDAKFDDNSAKSSNVKSKKVEITPNKVIVGAYAAAGAAFVGYAIADYYIQKSWHEKTSKSGIDFSYTPAKSLELLFRPGEPVSAKDYMTLVKQSKTTVWGGGPVKYFTKSALEREDFTLPLGHTFHRLSRAAEEGFGNAGTYSTIDLADFSRYVFGFGKLEKGKTAGLQHITFQATKEIKIASAKTQLEAMRAALKASGSPYASDPNFALRILANQTGGKWMFDNPEVKGFFAQLKAMGYSGIIDEMDSGVIGEAPVVLFDHDSFGAKAASVLTSADVKRFASQITEISNRKDKEVAKN